MGALVFATLGATVMLAFGIAYASEGEGRGARTLGYVAATAAAFGYLAIFMAAVR